MGARSHGNHLAPTSPAPTRPADGPLALALALLAVGLAALVYYPITANYFVADDFLNLYHIVNDDLIEYLVRPHGGHLLVTRNALFYLSFHLFGLAPGYFLWMVLLTHLLNVALLFQIIRRLTGSVPLACFGAALWGSAPVHEGTLGWYSVYGHVLVGTALFTVLLALSRVGQGRPAARGAPFVWALLLLAATTSFGVGIGVTLVLPVAAWLLLPSAAPGRWRLLIWLLGVAALVPPIYFGLQWLHVNIYDGNTTALPLMMEGLQYVSLIAGLMIHLVGFGITCLMSGMFYRANLYPGPIGHGLIALYAAILAVAMVRGPWPARRQIFACLLLALSCYGIIASGRGWFLNEGARVGLIRSERFQYVGMGMLSLALCIALARLAEWRRLRMRPAVATALVLAWLAATAVGYLRLRPPIRHFPAARRETAMVVAALRARLAAAPPGADVYIDNQPFRAVGPLLSSPTLFPGWAGVFAIVYPDNVVDGRRVYFVVPDATMLPVARRGRRATTLLLGPDERPGGNGDGPR